MKENEIRPAKVLELSRKKSNPVELKLTSPVNGALPERHEPDGGEDGAHSLEKTDADEHWSDWEAEDDENDQEKYQEEEVVGLDRQSSLEKKSERASPAKVIKKPLIVSDLSALEIQVKSREDEIDYFADMEPTITSTPALFTPVPASVPTKSDGLDFNVQSLEDEKDGDDGWNWDD